MRTLLVLSLLAFLACKKPPPAPTAAPPEIAPAPAPPVPVPLVTAPDAGTPAAPTPPLTPAEQAALNSYAAFSDDGFAFAAADMSPGAGVEVLTFYAAPTETVEKRLVLDSPPSRQKAAADLAADGFPRPGAKVYRPPGMATEIRGKDVLITMSGRPVTKLFAAFPDSPALTPRRAELLAVSKDGKLAAVRVESAGAVGEFGPAKNIRIVPLFP